MLKHRQTKNTVTFHDGKDIIIEYLDYMNGVNKTNKKYTYQIYIFTSWCVRTPIGRVLNSFIRTRA